MLVQVRRYPVLRNEISNIDREVGRVFNTFFQSPVRTEQKDSPALDVIENGSDTVLLVELPGVQKDEVKISVEDDILTISGSRKKNILPEKASWVRNEIRAGEFSRSVRLPKGTSPEKISAEMANGILKVTVPKADSVKPREIRIN